MSSSLPACVAENTSGFEVGAALIHALATIVSTGAIEYTGAVENPNGPFQGVTVHRPRLRSSTSGELLT